MAGIVIGAIVGSVVSEAVGIVVADAVLGMVIESGITAVAADVLGASLATAMCVTQACNPNWSAPLWWVVNLDRGEQAFALGSDVATRHRAAAEHRPVIRTTTHD